MEKLISCRCKIQSVPESYIHPPETRPGKIPVPLLDSIPTIDFEKSGNDRTKLVHQIMQACQESGFFQLINHGVSESLISDVLNVAKEFFELPAEDKARLYSEDSKESCRMYTSLDYAREKIHYWRDILLHPGHPVKENMQLWPQKPTQYREVIGSYSNELRKLSMWILDLIGEGLGLEPQQFKDSVSQVHRISINHYPPCPDPSLTLGLPKHGDINPITVLIQGNETGLQVLEDGQWRAVKPLPNAILVIIGYTLQVISNGKLKPVQHRVVTSSNVARTTVLSSLHPSWSSHIGPAKQLVSKYSPPLYQDVIYKDFMTTCVADCRYGKMPLGRYKFQCS